MRLLTECCVRRGYFEVRGREGLREGEQVMNSSPKENWQRKRNTRKKKKWSQCSRNSTARDPARGCPHLQCLPFFLFFSPTWMLVFGPTPNFGPNWWWERITFSILTSATPCPLHSSAPIPHPTWINQNPPSLSFSSYPPTQLAFSN
jgi:hypothetical protein